MGDSGYPQRQPCRDLILFKEMTDKEHEERRLAMSKQDEFIQELKELVAGQNTRIALLEQQNKLIFWFGGVVSSALIVATVGLIIQMMKVL